jgi:DNA-directed RNA polymerase specialized sigma24 family protein
MHGGMQQTRGAAPDPAVDEGADPYAGLGPLVAAEAAAEAAGSGGGAEAADLEQAVWLRLVECGGRPGGPGGAGRWVRAAVRAAAREAGEGGEGTFEGAAECEEGGVEALVVEAEHQRVLVAAVRSLPGRCPRIVTALMSRSDRTYREISRELGISQGSLGPLRSRCLRCLRTILNSRVGAPVGRGNAR